MDIRSNIHVAHRHAGEVMATAIGPAAFLWAGAAYPIVLVFDIYQRTFVVGASTGIAIFALVMLLVVGAGAWGAYRRITTRWQRARDGATSDREFRIRLVGEGADTASIVERVVDQPFEPLAWYSIFGISYVRHGYNEFGKATKGDAAASVSSDLAATQRGVLYALTGAFVLAILGTSWLVHGRRPELGPLPVMAAAGLAAVVLSSLTPTYVRVSPGALDILRSGWVPEGVPRFERWDLKKARILADARSGIVRIWDDSHPRGAAIMLRARYVMCGRQSLIAAVLNASVSSYPTPPLPEDSLLG